MIQNESSLVPITIADGDGIGPEIMRSTLSILMAAGARISPEAIEIGEKSYLNGDDAGIPEEAWESLYRTKILLKGPITTPQGEGYKSLNVTLRKTLQLFANVRRCCAYSPYVSTRFPQMDLVIIRENEEDTYVGIEHQQTLDVFQCLKLISKPGCERIIRYAFEYAKQSNRKTVTCLTKDNIMKMTDGLFHRVFKQVALEYPEIRAEHYIVDIGSARLATQPERFSVIVTLNLYGDILSDICAQMAGSVGLAGSANVGKQMLMFEAVHGSAPDIAGKNIANPSGLLHSAIQMLVHLNQCDIAARIENAWLKTLEEGIHTPDIYSTTYSKQRVTTQEFTQAVIERLGTLPQHFHPIVYVSAAPSCIVSQAPSPPIQNIEKKLVGVDIFIDNPNDISVDELVQKITALTTPLRLMVMMSLGLKIWPNSRIFMPYLRHCCCRFQITDDPASMITIEHEVILQLLQQFNRIKLDVIKTENLYTFNHQLGFTLAQGQ